MGVKWGMMMSLGRKGSLERSKGCCFVDQGAVRGLKDEVITLFVGGCLSG
jgi:hypothetical protein